MASNVSKTLHSDKASCHCDGLTQVALETQGDTELPTESDFHDEMESLYRRTGDAIGYWPSRFLAAVRRHGGLPYARKLLVPGAPSAGFDQVAEAGRADLSVEYLALDQRFRHLFTKEERDECSDCVIRAMTNR